jgi:hypothetical protein
MTPALEPSSLRIAQDAERPLRERRGAVGRAVALAKLRGAAVGSSAELPARLAPQGQDGSS